MPLISPQLKDALICPICKDELEEDDAKNVLRCVSNGHEFPVYDGLPDMVPPRVEDGKEHASDD